MLIVERLINSILYLFRIDVTVSIINLDYRKFSSKTIKQKYKKSEVESIIRQTPN